MRFKDYKIREYTKVTDYKSRHKPKYHEYKSYHQYETVRNYGFREYKPKRTGYHGYKATITKRITKPKLLPKRENVYRPERWPQQIRHCYGLPGGPEYPVTVYKVREYKPKPHEHKYREYNGYKAYENKPEYKGNVNYQLTPDNYYGFRRGKRVYRPITPDLIKKPREVEKTIKSQPKLHTKPITKEQSTISQQSQKKRVVAPENVKVAVVGSNAAIASSPKRKTIVNRGDNGMYKARDYTSYHEYDHVNEYKGYHEYEQKSYDHHYEYTSLGSKDGKPHLQRIEPITEPVTHKPQPEPRIKPVVAAVARKPVERVIREKTSNSEDKMDEVVEEEKLKNVESVNETEHEKFPENPKDELKQEVDSRVVSPEVAVIAAVASSNTTTERVPTPKKASPIPTPKQQSPVPTPRQSPVPTPRQSPVPSPRQYPVPTPRQSPVPSPRQSPVPTPRQSPVPSPRQSPVPTPRQSPVPTPVRTSKQRSTTPTLPLPAAVIVSSSNNVKSESQEKVSNVTTSQNQTHAIHSKPVDKIKTPSPQPSTQVPEAEQEGTRLPAIPVVAAAAVSSSSNTTKSNSEKDTQLPPVPSASPPPKHAELTSRGASPTLPIIAAIAATNTTAPPPDVPTVNSKPPEKSKPVSPKQKTGQPIRKSSITESEAKPVILPIIPVPAPVSSRPTPKDHKSNDVYKGRLPPEVVATIDAYNNAHLAALNPMGALGSIRRSKAMMG